MKVSVPAAQRCLDRGSLFYKKSGVCRLGMSRYLSTVKRALVWGYCCESCVALPGSLGSGLCFVPALADLDEHLDALTDPVQRCGGRRQG